MFCFFSRFSKILVFSALLTACLSISALALDEAVAVGATTGSDLNLRGTASLSGSIITRLDKGVAVAILDDSNPDWYKVAYRGMEGYVSSAYMVVDQDGLFSTFGAPRESNTYLWEAPSIESAVLETITYDMVLTITGFSDGWYAVTSPNGISGYIRSTLIDLQSTNVSFHITSLSVASSASASQVVDTAKQYLGVRYSYGGSSPSGFDCSGFTMYIYGQYGVSLPHSATSQWTSGLGTRIYNVSELQAGDLVFFRDPSVAGGKACSHVGIYISNGQFIHSSSSAGISISTLTSGYWGSYFVGGIHL